MFTYTKGLDKYVAQRRQMVKDKNTETIERIEILAGKFTQDSIATYLASKIIDSVKRSTNEIYERPTSTISFVSNLRFLFETCITTRLLVNEPGYKYKLRYSIYRHQIKKSQSLTAYAQEDLERLDQLIREENALQPTGPNLDDIEDSFSKIDELYNRLDEEISIFLDMAEHNGADYHKTFIYSFLENHKRREKEISDEWDRIKSTLLENEEANKLFDFKGQLSRVEKELSDGRTWQKKATDVGLGIFYDFVYNYTSSLIHSTSYSIFIPNQLEEGEIIMISGLATRITNDILKNICLFAKIPNMKILKIDG